MSRDPGVGADADRGAARVAALVPHFRCERWLDHCLASLMDQTRPLDAVVVVDDASPEPPEAIVRRYPGVTLLRAEANVGPYRLIQQVIDDTAFDWYLLQDADDWSAPDRLVRLLEAADRTGAGLVGSDYQMLCTDEVATIVHAFPLDANAALAAAPTCHALQHPTSLVRRSLVERLGGYSAGMRFSGDDEFLRRAAHVARVVNVPRVLYYRRHRADSLTTSPLTGHGSPSRQSVLEALARRARANAEAAAAGRAPVLEPFATAAPTRLTHVRGPRIGGSRPRRARANATRVPRPAPRPRPRPRGSARPPIFVMGGPASGADALVCALGQHPELVAVGDLAWLRPLVDAVARVDAPSVATHVSLSATRELRPLDAVGRAADELRTAAAAAVADLLAGPRPRWRRADTPGPPDSDPAGGSADEHVRGVAAGAPAGTRGWVGLLPPEAEVVGAALRLFPEARILHVVRDADEVAAALGRRSKANARPLDAGDAYRAWLAAVDVGLDTERRFGSARVRRIGFDELTARPEPSVALVLDWAGLPSHRGCWAPLEALDLTEAPIVTDVAGEVETQARARLLSHALCGPPLLRTPSTTSPGAPDPVVAPARPPTAPDPVEGPAAVLRMAVPPGGVVAAVTKGDPAFTRLDGLAVWHFPQAPDGGWAGYHPAGTAEIVAELVALADRGAGYFLVPFWARWWLDHYDGLAEILATHARLVADSADGGVLYALGDLASAAPPPTPVKPPARPIASTGGFDGAVERVRPARRGARPSVSVISWNMTHNPVGRAHVLAELLRGRFDVELVGARFDRFGAEVWPPVRDSGLPLRTFAGGPFPELQRAMAEFAATLDTDAVVVSKPRLPSYALGMMAKALRNRPLVLDVDDWEPAFVDGRGSRSLDDLRGRRSEEALLNPYGRLWTEYLDGLVGCADALTVSNPTLGALYGGTVVPHARDERLFDPSRVDRRAVRERLGLGPGDRVVLFGGTPRRHKGIVDLARALAEVGDDRARLCLIETAELAEIEAELAPFADLVHRVPYQPLRSMPDLVGAADVVAVLQDPASDVSRFQMPAKITDALAMGVPCLVRPTPPLGPLLAGGYLEPLGPEGLTACLTALLADLDGARHRARRGRDVFLAEMSFAAVRPRLEMMVTDLLAEPPSLRPAQRDFLAFARECFGPPAGSAPGGPARPEPQAVERAAASAGAGIGASARRRAPIDLVMFWKQNDTGIYGRRHDMLMAHLARSERVNQVIQFDAPIAASALAAAPADIPSHAPLVRDRTLLRIGGHDALPNLHQHSFVYSDDDQAPSLPRRDEFGVYVKETLARYRCGERPVVFWVYPKLFEFPDIARSFGPDLVVADVVDDHRSWVKPGAADAARRVEDHYAEIASLSDVVFTNCEAMRATMATLAPNVHLVPNGADWPDRSTVEAAPPEELAGLPRPILGYVGNLSARLDVDLLDRLARSRPDASLVLVGSAHAGREVLRLREHPNVVFTGPRPYEEAKRFVRAFDVGLIPHLDDGMTRSMHPLKAFVYATQGVPVVATDIANLDELRTVMAVAGDADEFLARVDEAVAGRHRAGGPEVEAVLRANSWSVRAARALELIDERLVRKEWKS